MQQGLISVPGGLQSGGEVSDAAEQLNDDSVQLGSDSKENGLILTWNR